MRSLASLKPFFILGSYHISCAYYICLRTDFFYCGEIDSICMYDLVRIKFLWMVCLKHIVISCIPLFVVLNCVIMLFFSRIYIVPSLKLNTLCMLT
jgi:hypothetical protein